MMEETATYSKSDAKEEYSVVDLSQISLRPISLSDLDDVMLWTSDAKVAKYCTWEPYTNKEKGIDFIQNIASKSLWFRAICLRDRAIGCTEFQVCSDRCRDKSAQLGYSLSSMYWGKGIATMVVKHVVEAAFKEFPYLERLEARVDVENVASQRVLEKAGFEREGVLRKYLCANIFRAISINLQGPNSSQNKRNPLQSNQPLFNIYSHQEMVTLAQNY